MWAGSPWNGMRSRASFTQLETIWFALKRRAAGRRSCEIVDRRRARSSGTGQWRAQTAAAECLREDRDVEGVLHAARLGLGADQIAVVEHDGAGSLKGEHRAHMFGDGTRGSRHQALRVALTQRADLIKRQTGRDIAIDQVVRGGLIGDDVGHDAARHDLG